MSQDLWLLDTNAPLELWAQRIGRRVKLRQTINSRRASYPLRGSLASFSTGLPRFVTYRFVTPSGAVAAKGSVQVCPNSMGWIRYDEANPAAPEIRTYPNDCGYVFGRRIVWGIDQGWATQIPVDTSALQPGNYTLEATVDPAHLLQQSTRADDHVRVEVHVGQSTAPGTLRAPPAAVRRNFVPAPGLPPSAAEVARDVGLLGRRLPPRIDLPNLVAMPADGITISSSGGRDLLSFGSNVANLGRGDVGIIGYRMRGRPDTMRALQVLYRGGQAVASRPAGTLTYDSDFGHFHWHYSSLARYRILNARGRAVQTSGKIGFCFGATNAIDLGIPGVTWNPTVWIFGGPTSSGTDCGKRFSPSVRMNLNAGWGDEYLQCVAGQSFDITNLPNGTYHLQITVNANHNLLETTSADNTSVRRFSLSGMPGQRVAVVARWHGIDPEVSTESGSACASG